MEVHFNNLKALHESIPSLDQTIRDTLADFNFIRGPQVIQFENTFKKIVGTQHCIATANGTDALFIILKSLGITAGDEVITPAFSWVSSSETISLCGARPVFADVNATTFTLNPDEIEKRITNRTKAVIAVHLYGHAAPIAAIKKICERHRLFLIEDCAQAHLTQEEGKYVGTFGDAAAFSFYPTKNLGAYGDAGCILTNNPVLDETIRRFANHGALQKDDHLIEGMNSRMDTLQAAILLAKLPYLEKWNEQRRTHAQLYRQLLNGVEALTLPIEKPGTTHTFHLFVIRAQQRNELRAWLTQNRIQTLIHYPQALPNLEAYRYLNHTPADFPVASALQNEVLSLPVGPELKIAEITYVCGKIREFYNV